MLANLRPYQIDGSPAHAGIDLLQADYIIAGKRFPRTRGDRPPFLAAEGLLATVPPHTRG